MFLKNNIFYCGLFGITEDFIEPFLSLDEKFMKNRESIFFARARGSSMLPEIKPNDILIIDRSLKPQHKSIITAFYNGSPLCKEFFIKQKKTYLRSFNPKFKALEVQREDELEIFGVVIGLSRDF